VFDFGHVGRLHSRHQTHRICIIYIDFELI